LGGDLVSTWVAKLEVHVEDVTQPRKKLLQNQIVANKKRNFANDVIFFNNEEALDKAA
jgi:hypothetical protein